MTGAKRVHDVAVVFAALILIANQQTNWSTRCHAFKNAGKNFNLVCFLTLSDMAGSAWLASVQIGLQICFSQRQTGWAAINHTTNGGPMAFPKITDHKKATQAASGHACSLE